MSPPSPDPFAPLLNLEQTFYNEGHAAGVLDGERAGHIEGRVFGLEKGFEKYVRMGRLFGRAVVWGGRLPPGPGPGPGPAVLTTMRTQGGLEMGGGHQGGGGGGGGGELKGSILRDPETVPPPPETIPSPSPLPSRPLPNKTNPRLEKHIRTLYALVEPSSLLTANSEEAVSEFDDRLKRAEGKVKVIERLVGESGVEGVVVDGGGKGNGDGGSIEEIGGERVRR